MFILSCLQMCPLSAAELEFVQIIIILVVMMVMVVVIICLLNHYRLSALAFLSRHSRARHQGHRQQATQLVGLSQDTLNTSTGN